MSMSNSEFDPRHLEEETDDVGFDYEPDLLTEHPDPTEPEDDESDEDSDGET